MLLTRNNFFFEKKNIIFFCFGNINIGLGHLFRSQILAKKLKQFGWKIYLAGPNINYKGILNLKIYEKVIYSNEENITLSYLKKFINQTIGSLKQHKISSLYFDTYFIDNKLIKTLKKKYLIISLTDNTNNHYSDLSINYSFNSKLTKNKNKLLGPKYSIISKNYTIKKITYNKKILINLGGSAQVKLAEQVTKIVKRVLIGYNITIATPSLAIRSSLLKSDNLNNIDVKICHSLISLLKKNKFEFIISTAGHSAYEILSTLYPSIIISIVKNQQENVKFLDNNNLCTSINFLEKNYKINFENILKSYVKNKNSLKISKKISKIINPNGDRLIVDCINKKFLLHQLNDLQIIKTKNIYLVPINKKNYKKLYNLRKLLPRMSFKNKSQLSKKNHDNWFNNYFDHNRLDYLIYNKEFNKYIGSVSAKLYNKNTIEIGNFISFNNYLRTGFGYEAMLSWLEFLYKKYKIKKFVSITSYKNISNINLKKKLGFMVQNKNRNKKWEIMLKKIN